MVDLSDLSDFSVLSAFELDASVVVVVELESVFVLALSDFLSASVLLVFGELALSADGLVALVADSAGLLAVEAGAAVAVVAGLVAGVAVVAGVVGEGLVAVALTAGVVVAAAVAEAEGVVVAAAVAAGVALGKVEALELVVVVAPVVVPEVTPTLKFGTVTP